MSEHDQIETVIGNEVGKITQPSKNAIDGLNSLTDKLSDNAIGDLIPGGLTGDGLLSKSLRCRLEELGGAILDLIEDGFGIADMLNGFEMPSLSELGEKLAQLNPMNLLEKLGDLSIEGITAKVGELIEGAVGMIGDIVNKTFEQVERVIKGVADMFDEFGDAIQNVGELVDDVITGIIGGVGEVLQDLTKPIEDIVDALFAPCDKKTQTAGAAEQQKLLENKQLLDTDIQLNANNVMNINETAQTSGTVSRIAKKSVGSLVETNVNSDQLPFEVDSKHAAAASDAQNKNAQENAKRKEIEVETTTLAKQQIGDQVVKQTIEKKNEQNVEFTKQVEVESTNESGELQAGPLWNEEDDCAATLTRFDKLYHRVWDLSNSVVESKKTYADGTQSISTTTVSGFWAVTPSGVDNLMLVRSEFRDEGDQWFVVLSEYKVLQAIQVYKNTGKWPENFLSKDSNNYGVIAPKYLDNLKEAWELTGKIIGDQNYMKKLRKCIVEDDEKKTQQEIAAIEKTADQNRFSQEMIQAEKMMSDRSGRLFVIDQLQSFHDRFLAGGDKQQQKWGDTDQYELGPFDGITFIMVNICPAIAANGSNLISRANKK